MKIVKETQNIIVIKEKNIPFYAIGAIFILGGVSLLTILKPAFNNEPPIKFALLLILLGVFAILTLEITTVSIDKISNKLTIISRSIVRKKFVECLLNEIKMVELRLFYVIGEGYYPRIVFILANERELPLPLGKIMRIVRRQIINEKSIGPKIAAFLKIPFDEKVMSTINEILSEAQKIFKKR
jgi:hypothetical protein